MPVFDPRTFNVELNLRYTRWGWMVVPKNDQFVGDAVKQFGEYSPMECEVLARVLRPGDTVIEGGAHVGAVALPMLAAIGHTGRWIGFEPQPVFAMLGLINCYLNGYKDICEMYVQGLGSQPGTMRMPVIVYDTVGNYGGLDLKAWNQANPGAGSLVKIVTIDSLGLDRCDFIKLDIEGMEKDALEGASQTIERYHPTLSLECDREDTGPVLIEYVRGLGYTPYWMVTSLYSANNYYRAELDKDERICAFNILCVHPTRLDRMTVQGLHEAQASDPMGKIPMAWAITGLEAGG